MEINKISIKVVADKETCIILPKKMQHHDYFKEIQEIVVSFGLSKVKVPINFHNGDQLLLSKTLAEKLCFPFKNTVMHSIITNSVIKLGPLLAIYVKEDKAENFGVIDNLLKDFAIICNKFGLAHMVFTPNSSDFQKQIITGYLYNKATPSGWEKHRFPFPDIIMDRGIFGTTKEWNSAHKERKVFQELLDILKFNSPIGNKYELHTVLNKNSMVSQYMPETEILNSLDNFNRFFKKHSCVYIKPINGTQGQGIYKIYKQNNVFHIRSNQHLYTCKGIKIAKSIINKSIIANKKRRYLLQQEIKLFKIDNRIIDFRILLQKKSNLRWGVTANVARIGKENDITSNLSNGGTVKDAEVIMKKIANATGKKHDLLMQQIKDIAILAAYTIETEYGTFGELGIDIGVDTNGKPWIIEINPRPGRKSLNLINKTLRLKSLQIPIEYCLQLWFQYNRGNLK